MDLSNFFFRQKVNADDMNQFRDDADKAVKNTRKELHGKGVASGLLLTAQGTPSTTWNVSAGAAYDGDGQRCAIPNQVVGTSTLPGSAPTTPGNKKFQDVYVSFARVDSDVRIDGNNQQVYYRSSESYTLSVVNGTEAASPVPPAAPSASAVLLARITLYQGMTVVANADINNDVRTLLVNAEIGSAFWIDPVINRYRTSPAGSPNVGDRYIVAGTATGAWAGHEDDIAEWNGSAWAFTTAASGSTVLVTESNEILDYYDPGGESSPSWRVLVGSGEGGSAASTGVHAPVDAVDTTGAPQAGYQVHGRRTLINHAAPTGAWAGQEHDIAIYDVFVPGSWRFEEMGEAEIVFDRNVRQWWVRSDKQYPGGLHNAFGGEYWLPAVKDHKAGSPPGSPAVGERYLVITGTGGAWVGITNKIVEWNGAAWDQYTPRVGQFVYSYLGPRWFIWTGAAWEFAAENLIGAARSYQGPVLNLLSDPPGVPTVLDRYIVGSNATGAWAGMETRIAEWSGIDWKFSAAPVRGWLTWRNVGSTGVFLYFDGAAWRNLEVGLDHNLISGKQASGGANEFYHLTLNQHKAAVGGFIGGGAGFRYYCKTQAVTPPSSPALGDRHFVIATATDAWAGKEGQIAEWDGTAWLFETMAANTVLYIENVNSFVRVSTGGNGTVIEAALSHNSLKSGTIQGGRSNEYYHQSLGQANATLDHVGRVENILNDPPSSPNPGERWIVGTAPTGAWASQAGKIAEAAAVNPGNPWYFHATREGATAYRQSDGRYYRKLADGTWVIHEATTARAGLLASADKAKLDVLSGALGAIRLFQTKRRYATDLASANNETVDIRHADSRIVVPGGTFANGLIIVASIQARVGSQLDQENDFSVSVVAKPDGGSETQLPTDGWAHSDGMRGFYRYCSNNGAGGAYGNGETKVMHIPAGTPSVWDPAEDVTIEFGDFRDRGGANSSSALQEVSLMVFGY